MEYTFYTKPLKEYLDTYSVGLVSSATVYNFMSSFIEAH